ncbi:unnamed protein product [Rotaria socialis]
MKLLHSGYVNKRINIIAVSGCKLLHLYPVCQYDINSTESYSSLQRTIASLEHLDVICDGCSMAPLKGIRYQCEQCVPIFDLCDNCLRKSHTHHTLKIIPHALLHSVNQKALAQRTIILANLNGVPKWRDPLTG